SQPTLEFPEPGKSAGNGSCNRFIAPVTISGDSIAFGAIGSTRMMCPEPIATQETKYFEALRLAGRFTVNGDTLWIFSSGTNAPLRLLRVLPAVTR
ncbi:MAG: META domain-containing protein, partial [Gemmatimonadaceae bacterium]